MSSNLPYKQAANVERRTWDKDLYESRAKARAKSGTTSNGKNKAPTTSATLESPIKAGKKRVLENDEEEKEEFVKAEEGAAGPALSKRAYLKARRKLVDLESKVGSTEIINPDAVAVSKSKTDGTCKISDGVEKAATGVGWYCKVCDCYLKDSIGYLDHINGRKHQRFLGYSMRVEKSNADQVRVKLSELSKKKQQQEQDAKQNDAITQYHSKDVDDMTDFEDLVRKKDQEAKRRKAERAARRKELKKKQQEQEQEKQQNDEPEEEEEALVHQDLASMMGFSGFGGSLK